MKLVNKRLKADLELCNNLIALMESGFSLKESLIIYDSNQSTQIFRDKLEKGEDFITLLKAIDFDADGVLIMEIGIESKDFLSSLCQVEKVLASKEAKQREIIDLLKYPLMLVGISVLAIGFVILFLIPQFEQILMSMGTQSSGVTLIFVFFKILPLFLTISLVVITIVFLYFQSQNEVKRLILIFKWKYTRKFYISIYNQVFATVISDLLIAGLSMQLILRILRHQKQNKLLAYEGDKIAKQMERGYKFSEALSPRFYDRELIKIVEIGEEYGLLGYYLQSYCSYITTKNDKRTMRFIFWLQPIFYLIFGLLILGLYAAIFIPMFALMDSI